MEAIYPYANIIHLLLAIIFLGYVFTDTVMISALKDKFGKDTDQKINQTLGAKSFKIFPLSLLVIVLTGGMMMSKYINSDAGLFETTLQKLLVIKIILALIIVLGVLYNLYTKLTKKPKHPFMQEHFHKLVLVLGFFIVVLAKLMFTA
ncbi:MAG: hypothetical protein WC279_06380 [Sulfurimonas sp.]|jgi:hypothetical protein|uniref:hypothetical protein n=1 Tax=unclassified Sulfurimonas TaxID=2623549 RepID=UPI0008BF550B|nr:MULTISPECIES: hypothetical protein [unclassified Sulfurimonas]MBS4067934.1 hypothetical protein [Sulfurimonas sp.]MDD3855359.1 hypothetical protein [Sulfurimonas sp.]OHE05977.1 MAG: hypothetical protein A2345_09600 [Sulfurimonas sp. RIFOXYB12_FULL_35_9]OHE08053.1 MAG: hypothetical protein A3J96_01395 [Sulfurimonas sp. RIFOXYC2_FULL_36_7]